MSTRKARLAGVLHPLVSIVAKKQYLSLHFLAFSFGNNREFIGIRIYLHDIRLPQCRGKFAKMGAFLARSHIVFLSGIR